MGVIASASVDSGLSCLVFMARFLRLPVDPEQIRFEAGKVDVGQVGHGREYIHTC
jgi:hypothetical protein